MWSSCPPEGALSTGCRDTSSAVADDSKNSPGGLGTLRKGKSRSKKDAWLAVPTWEFKVPSLTWHISRMDKHIVLEHDTWACWSSNLRSKSFNRLGNNKLKIDNLWRLGIVPNEPGCGLLALVRVLCECNSQDWSRQQFSFDWISQGLLWQRLFLLYQ